MRKQHIILFFLLFLGYDQIVHSAPSAIEDTAPGLSRQNSNIIKNVKVVGNKRIEDFTVKNFLSVKEGDVYDESKINKALKNIYNTGLFHLVELNFDRGNLVINIEENPLVNKVIFEGNDGLKTEDLNRDLILKSRSAFSKSKFRDDLIRIRNIYSKSGRLNAKIVPKIIELPDNRVNLIYEIDEGKKTSIKKIVFVGANIFTPSDLRAVISSKQRSLMHFFSSSTQFDEEKLDYDKELLRKFYNSHGYADFKATSGIADFSKHDNSITLTYVIEEGVKYRVDEVSVDNGIKNVSNDKISEVLSLKKGQIYNGDTVQADINAIIKIFSSEGYPFSDVDPELTRNVAEKKINIVYNIKPSIKIYLNRINIFGNFRTHDSIIRRELNILEGEPYNVSKIENSREKLLDLNFFKSVEITQKKLKEQDKIDLDVKVKEKTTAGLKFGLAYSTQDGILGKVGFSEINFLGRGQQISLDFIRYSKKYDIDFSFTEPYFMGKNLAAGIDINTETQKKDSDKSMTYSFKKRSAGTRLSYNITPHLFHVLRYTYQKSRIADISAATSEFIADQRTKSLSSMVGHSLIYDKRNSILSPNSGYLLRFDQEFAGLGGNAKYVRNQLTAKKYFPVTERITLKVYGKAGYIKGLGSRVLINDRFFNGENDIRGFEERGIGPRDNVTRAPSIIPGQLGELTQDALGGNQLYTAGAELIFPLKFVPKELDLSGHVFMESGLLKGLDLTPSQQIVRSTQINESNRIRSSIGIGIKCITRMGPIKLSLATPTSKKSYDRTQPFIFSMEID